MIYIMLFLSFFKIGLTTFGGGYAMIPLITETVVGRGWSSEAELIDIIAIAESTPGPFAVNAATFVGMRQAGFAGAAAATSGVVLPSFIIILIIAKFIMRFAELKGVKWAMEGLRPAVAGLVLAAGLSIAFTCFGVSPLSMFSDGIKAAAADFNLSGLVMFLLVGAAYVKFKLNAYKIIGLSAAMGLVWGYAVRLL